MPSEAILRAFYGNLGSPGTTRHRMSFSLQFPLLVPCGRSRSRPAAPPAVRPRESAAEQAKRFRRLLESGEYRSQSELARALGCSQPWISKALAKASERGPQAR